MLHEKITEKIINSYYRVYNTLGYGFLEKVYENSLLIDLRGSGLNVKQQKNIKVYYQNERVGDYFADLLVEDIVIVELKAVVKLAEEHETQLINYLRATEIEVGLLLNFGKKPAFRRKIFENKFKKGISYYRIDWDNRMLQPVLSFGKDAENVMECGFSLDKGISGSIALTGQPEIVNDALSDPRAFHVPGTRDEVEAIMCLPLTDGERSIGVFCLYRLDGGIFTMEELETARLFSTQAEVAIRNAGLLKESKRRTHLLSTVLDLGRDINASLDIEEICKALYTKCSSVIDTSDFFIALLEEDFKTVNYIFLKDRDQTIHDLRLPFADTIAGYAIKSGQSVLLDEEILGSAARKFNRPYAPKSGIVTPLHAMNRIVGAVSVQSYEADVYDEESRLFLEILARQAGAALHLSLIHI